MALAVSVASPGGPHSRTPLGILTRKLLHGPTGRSMHVAQGHAYSVVAIKEIDGFKLVKLRNPWGRFEWKGNWSDNSPLWRQYPKVAKAVDFAAADDGMFWMDFKDFCQYYKVGR